jgi:hypothetical protein
MPGSLRSRCQDSAVSQLANGKRKSALKGPVRLSEWDQDRLRSAITMDVERDRVAWLSIGAKVGIWSSVLLYQLV